MLALPLQLISAEMPKRFSFLLLVAVALLTLGWAARSFQPKRSEAQMAGLEIPVLVEAESESGEMAYPEFFAGEETPEYIADRGYPVEIPGQSRTPAGADLVVEAIAEPIEDTLLEPVEPLSELPEAKLRVERSL